MSKKRLKKRDVKYTPKTVNNILRKTIVGTCMHWDDITPTAFDSDSITNTRFTHKNPSTSGMKKDLGKMIRFASIKMGMKWRVAAEMQFCGSDGKKYYRAAEVVKQGLLKSLSDDIIKACNEVFRESNMAQYIITHMTCEIIGDGEVKAGDFKLCADDDDHQILKTA